jgi:hypothetical protein
MSFTLLLPIKLYIYSLCIATVRTASTTVTGCTVVGAATGSCTRASCTLVTLQRFGVQCNYTKCVQCV